MNITTGNSFTIAVTVQVTVTDAIVSTRKITITIIIVNYITTLITII